MKANSTIPPRPDANGSREVDEALLAIQLQRLRQRQLDRKDVQDKLLHLAEVRRVNARPWLGGGR